MSRGHITSPVGARFEAPTNFLLLVILAAILSASPPAAESKLNDSDERSINLVTKLAYAPNLIAYDYLKNALGTPSRVSILPGGIARQAEWFDLGTNHTRYRYQQEFGPLVPVGCLRNHFELFLHEGADLDAKGLAKRLNSSCTTHFDQSANPTGFCKLSPNMTLEAHQFGSDRSINEICLDYVGPALAPPSQSEIVEALQVRRAEAFALHRQGYRVKAAPLLSSYLKDFPNDAEAHLKLAESYKAGGCLNQAINQYSLVYALSESNSPMRLAAERGLQALKVGFSSPANKPTTNPADHTPAQPAKAPRPALQNDLDRDPFSLELVESKIGPRPKSIASSAKVLDAGF
jgi:hypothetical protein